MKRTSVILAVLLVCVTLCSCGQRDTAVAVPETPPAAVEEAQAEAPEKQAEEVSEEKTEPAEPALPDGTYTARFDTDSGMFHVNEACNGRGTLEVSDGRMTLHVSLISKKILQLYPGLAENAAVDEAGRLDPTLDTVTYSDGLSEEVYGFDIPVPALDEEFDLALIGEKGKWYDHKVSVSDVEPVSQEEQMTAWAALGLEDGTYQVGVLLEGGSGRASVASPAVLMAEDGALTLQVIWSSSNYDFMMVGGEKYEPDTLEGGSTFTIPVAGFDVPLEVSADTVAMSTPHLVDYTLTLDSASITR